MRNGFTLSELLIALAILGVIATFTIPKVLSSQQGSQWKSLTKETVAMVSGAYQAYQQQNAVVAGTNLADLLPYMNYVRVDTSGAAIDGDPGIGGTGNCNTTASTRCLRLHNGAVLGFQTTSTFGSTDSTAALYFGIDPDGVATGNEDTISFVITRSGRIINIGAANSSIYVYGAPVTALGSADPPWFSWN